MKNFYQKLFKNTLTIALTVVVSSLVVVGVIYATTTIGTNVTTDGTLSVTGNATTSANLVVGTTSWAAPTSTLSVVGSAHFFNVATSSSAFWVGTGGTANNVDLAGGDLYVQGSTEIDGSIWTGAATVTGNATTTGNFVVGSTSWAAPTSTLTVVGNAHFFTVATTSEGLWVGTAGTATVDMAGGDIYVQGGAEFDGAVTLGDATGDTITINGHIANATTTGNFVIGSSSWAAPTSTLTVVGNAHFFTIATTSGAVWIGTGGVAGNVDLDGGDLYVQNDAEIDGSIYTGAATFSGAATTTGKAVFASTAPATTATSTVTFGSYGTADTKGLCLKFFSGGVTIWCYFDTARLTGGAATSTAFVCDSDSSCETN